MTRFQLVFRERGKGDRTETRDNNTYREPQIDGKLIVDGEWYRIRGVEWVVRRNGDGLDGMKRFVCTLAVVPEDDGTACMA